MFEFEFTKQGYVEAREFLKQIDKFEQVKFKKLEDVVRFANNEYLKRNYDRN